MVESLIIALLQISLVREVVPVFGSKRVFY